MPKVHQEVRFEAPPARVYEALASSSHHAKMTGEPADIGAKAGDAWTAYGGKISGRQIEVVAGKRIVQSWRAGNWPEGHHTLVRFEVLPDGDGTKLVLDHDALLEEHVAHIDGGWEKMYWEKLRAYLAS